MIGFNCWRPVRSPTRTQFIQPSETILQHVGAKNKPKVQDWQNCWQFFNIWIVSNPEIREGDSTLEHCEGRELEGKPGHITGKSTKLRSARAQHFVLQ